MLLYQRVVLFQVPNIFWRRSEGWMLKDFFFPPNRWTCHGGHGCIDFGKNVDLPCRKLRWQWNISIFNRRYIFNWLVFHCQVSFPGLVFPVRQVVRAGWRVHLNCLPWWSRTAHQDRKSGVERVLVDDEFQGDVSVYLVMFPSHNFRRNFRMLIYRCFWWKNGSLECEFVISFLYIYGCFLK